MFTLQISSAAARLREAGMSDNVIDTLMDMLGNCAQTLVHRGPVDITTDLPGAVYRIGDAATGDYPAAALTAKSGGTYNQTNNNIEGGFAARFDGPVFVKGPLVMTNPGAGYVGIAKAVSNWQKGGGNPFVMCRRLINHLGAVQPGNAFAVQLPRTTPGDPNVNTDAILTYGFSPDNLYSMATSPYMDDKIGTVKLWALAAGDVPAGWAVMDGSSNTTVGSGYDMTGKFAKGAGTSHTLGATGGSTAYTPEGTITGGGSTNTSTDSDSFTPTTRYDWTTPPEIASTTYTGSLEVDGTVSWPGGDPVSGTPSNYTGALKTEETVDADFGAGSTFATTGLESATEPNRGDSGSTTTVAAQSHTHDLAYSAIRHTHDISPTQISHEHSIPTSELAHTHTISSTNLAHTHTFNNLSHTHAGTTAGHYHTVDTSSLGFTGTLATIIPPFRNLYYIERIDNSA